MDEGLPVAYPVLEKGVPVIASDGAQVGTVHHVVAAPEQDIFHGLVINASGGRDKRFVAADVITALHERGVDLSIDSAQVYALPHPGGGAPVFQEDPGELKGWAHWSRKLTLRGDWKRER